MAEGTGGASAIPARGALFPFRVRCLKEKLYFTSALSSHKQASAVHTGKAACEDSAHARGHIAAAGSLQPCVPILSSTFGGGVDSRSLDRKRGRPS